MTDTAKIALRRLDAAQADFDAQLRALLAFEAGEDAAIDAAVARHPGRRQGARRRRRARIHAALRPRCRRASIGALEIGRDAMQAALDGLAPARRAALQTAAERVRAYHERQKAECGSAGFLYTEADGTVLGQKVTPLDRVGIYVPGGKAAYPSSVLMNAIPAKVAGVAELIMVVPTPDGVKNPLVLAAAALAGVDRVFTIGGAQAVGALAYGTATIAAGRQDRRPRQCLCRRGQAPRVRHGRHRHDRRAVGNPGHLRRHAPTRTGSRWTCFRRPSTTNWRNRSCSARMPPIIDAGRGQHRQAARRACRARK